MSKLLIVFFNEHKGMRRLSKGVLLTLVIFATIRVFMHMPDVNQAVALCYGTLVSATGAAIWKYMEARGRDDLQ